MSPNLGRAPMMTWAPTSEQVSTSGRMILLMIILACSGLADSSSASIITLKRRPPRSTNAARSAGAKSSTSSGNAADAARAISVATSSAVFPLACTAHDTESATARTALSPAGSEAETSASAVVTILPSTADFPTPGDPVTTNARRSGFSRLSHFVIAVSASDRPRKRNPRSLSPLTPRPLGFQCRTPSGSRSSVHPQAARAVSPASLAVHLVSSANFSSGKHRSI